MKHYTVYGIMKVCASFEASSAEEARDKFNELEPDLDCYDSFDIEDTEVERED